MIQPCRKTKKQPRSAVTSYLSSMLRDGYITEKQMKETEKVPVTRFVAKNTAKYAYEAFLDAAVKEVKGKLKDVDISEDGLSINNSGSKSTGLCKKNDKYQ